MSNVKRIDYDWSIFYRYDLRFYRRISSRIMCDINHPGLPKPLRKIHAIGWQCNIKKKMSKSSNIFRYRFL